MAKYSYIDKFYNNRALVKVNGKWGYIDENNIEVITPQYDDAFPFYEENFAIVKSNEQWSGIDKNGVAILQYEYEEFEPFYNDYFYGPAFRIKNNGKYGYIDAYGDVVIPLVYDYISDFEIGFEVIVGLNGKYGVYDVHEGEIITPIYATQESAWDAYIHRDNPKECKYNINGERKVYDHDTYGYVWIPAKYDVDFLPSISLESFWGGLLSVKVNNKYGAINKQFEEVIPIRYDYIGYFRKGVAEMRIHNRVGYINLKGEMRVKDDDQEAWIPTKYEWGDDYHEGLAAVLLSYKWGFINRNGEEVIPLIYDEVLAPGFCNGTAAVMLNGEWVKIDTKGKII